MAQKYLVDSLKKERNRDIGAGGVLLEETEEEHFLGESLNTDGNVRKTRLRSCFRAPTPTRKVMSRFIEAA